MRNNWNYIVKLFQTCLTESYFLWNDDFDEQKEVTAIGSPLSPFIANFFMEIFEQKTIDSFNHKPQTSTNQRYNSATWNSLKLRKDQHPSIKFTMEAEQNQNIAFLDILIKRSGRNLSHT